MKTSTLQSQSVRRRFSFWWLVGWLALSGVCWSVNHGALPSPSSGLSAGRENPVHFGRNNNAPLKSTGFSAESTSGRKQIEDIRVGERVWTEEHATTSQPTQVVPKTWRLLKLRRELRWPDGTLDDINAEALQSPAWIAQHGAIVGATVPLPVDLVEMGLPNDLGAVVLAVEPCPPIANGPGCVVLTTVNHLNADIRELTVEDREGRKQVLRPTGFHKFSRHGEKGWVSTCDLAIGDRLHGKDGPLRVIGNKRLPGVQRVYNMSIEKEHIYFVSALGLLTHNPGCAPTPGGTGQPVLNLGSGNNPMTGAINIDIRPGPNLVVDASKPLPFAPAAFGEVHSINPYGYQPVNSNVAAVMQPGSYLYVTGTPNNPFAQPLSASAAQAAGFQLVGTFPMIPAHGFGVQATTSGIPLNAANSLTTVYIRQ